MRHEGCMHRLCTAIVLKVLSFASFRLMVSGGNWAKAVREIITCGITLSLSCIKGRQTSAPFLPSPRPFLHLISLSSSPSSTVCRPPPPPPPSTMRGIKRGMRQRRWLNYVIKMENPAHSSIFFQRRIQWPPACHTCQFFSRSNPIWPL